MFLYIYNICNVCCHYRVLTELRMSIFHNVGVPLSIMLTKINQLTCFHNDHQKTSVNLKSYIDDLTMYYVNSIIEFSCNLMMK